MGSAGVGVLATIAAAVLLASCGRAVTVGSTQEPNNGVDADVSAPQPTQADNIRGEDVSPDPSFSVGQRAVPVRDYKPDDANSMLIAGFTGKAKGRGQCGRLNDVLLEESASEVRITLILGDRPGVDCRLRVGTPLRTSLRLEKPLGDRSVVDGSDAWNRAHRGGR